MTHPRLSGALFSSSIYCLSKDDEAGDACKNDHQDGMDAREINGAERGDTDGDCDESFTHLVTEVLAVHQ